MHFRRAGVAFFKGKGSRFQPGRERAGHCDPTLRINVLIPPTQPSGVVNGSNLSLSWTSGEGTCSDCTYELYQASSMQGTFSLYTTTTLTSATVPNGYTYMIRKMKTVSTGSGSYKNLSQGVFWPNAL